MITAKEARERNWKIDILQYWTPEHQKELENIMGKLSYWIGEFQENNNPDTSIAIGRVSYLVRLKLVELGYKVHMPNYEGLPSSDCWYMDWSE